MLRAGAGNEEAALGQALHGAQVDLLVATGRSIQRAATFREGRRIEHDHIPLVAALAGISQEVEHVGGDEAAALIQTIGLGIAAGQRHGILADIKPQHVLGAIHGGVQREAAGVRETIQARDGRVIFPLIQEMAGLLPMRDVHTQGQIILDNGELRIKGIAQESRALLQALLISHGHVVALIQLRQACHFAQGLDDEGFEAVHTQGHGLDHQHVVELVHHERGQAIGLAEDHAAARGVHEASAVLPRGPDLSHEEDPVDRFVQVLGDEPGDEFALRVVVGLPQRALLHVEDLHDAAGLRIALGAAHRIVIDPRVPVADALARVVDVEARAHDGR